MINNINTVYALFAITMCLVLAYFVAFTDLLSDRLTGTPRIIFIVLMLVYAAFRAYRVIRTLKKPKQENKF